MKSIQTKFIVLILSCLIISSAVIGGAGILNAKKVTDVDSTQIMNLICSDKVKELNALFSRIEQSVKTLSTYATEQLENVEQLKNDNEYLKKYTEKVEAVAINAANNTEGAVAVYVRFNPEFTSPTSGIFWSKTELNGRFQRLVPTDFSSYNPADTEHVGWYYIPVKNGKATWMAPYFNENIKIKMVSYVIPLYMSNETIGVVGMDIDFSIIESIVKDIHIYKNGYAFVASQEGNIVYHKELEMGASMPKVDASLKSVVNELENGTNGSSLFSYQYRTENKKMAFRNLQNGMRLVLTASIKEIDQERNSLILQIVIALVVIMVFSVILTILMTRHLVRPLKELNAAAQKIAAGDLSIELTQPTKDEVGMLAENFQKTVNHLQTYITYINGLAYRDSLTGVKNKTAYLEAEHRLEEQIRLGRPEFAVVVMDINGLKVINDTYGHDFGDMLIIDACKIICKAFKRSPVFRVGGDEFVTILEGVDYEHYAELLEQFQIEIDTHNKESRQDSQISIARGIAIYNSTTDLVFANVFKRADDTMYKNKAGMKSLTKNLQNHKEISK